MKTTFDILVSRLNTAEERINELEENVTKSKNTELHIEKR